MELNMYELMTISWGSNVDKLWEEMRTQYTVKVTRLPYQTQAISDSYKPNIFKFPLNNINSFTILYRIKRC